MITLLLDSSSRTMHIGIARNHKLIASHTEAAFQTQSELFTARINELLRTNNIDPQTIGEIVVSHGPGSFTGVRIAATIAKVMAYALNVPLYSVSTLALFATEDKPTICVLDARNNRSFAGVYHQNNVLIADTIMQNDDTLKLASDNGYAISGETKHLGLTSAQFNPFLNMLNLISEDRRVSDVKAFKPRYFKG